MPARIQGSPEGLSALRCDAFPLSREPSRAALLSFSRWCKLPGKLLRDCVKTDETAAGMSV